MAKVASAKSVVKKLDRSRLKQSNEAEQERFRKEHPRSHQLFEKAKKSLLNGVPMNWMAKWAGGFPVFVERASGAHFTDVDSHEYVDLCLGDTGAMTGHSPPEAIKKISEQLQCGITFMLPTENAIWLADELTRRFALPYWQFALTATDANRFSIRMAREITRRRKILVFNWCYHGTVDESFITLKDGKAQARRGNIGPPLDPSLTTAVVEFNDIPALEKALATQEIACVLAEPVMTNVGIVHPEPGFHETLRALTRKHGTLLIIDETHTICTGPGGYTRQAGLEPDFFVLGKPIASGIPGAVYGFTREVAERISARIELADCDTGGIGGTLAGNALSLAAMRVTLEKVLTAKNFEHMIAMAERFAEGVETAINEAGAPWHVTRLGCRAEYLFCREHPRNGGQAAAAADFELERYMHLQALNRGILLTPFHNMALMCPATSKADVDAHTAVFRQAVNTLFG